MFGEESQENSEFTPLEEGTYLVTLDDVSFDDTGKHPMVNTKWSVISGQYKNRKLWKRFYFSEGTSKKFLPWQMGVMGIKSKIDEKNAQSFVETAKIAMGLMGELIGQSFNVSVSITEGLDGKQYNDLVVSESVSKSDYEFKTPDELMKPVTAALPAMDINEEVPF